LRQVVSRSLLSLAGVAIVTLTAFKVIAVNATTVGFAYLLLVLVIATAWGFAEAALASVAATLAFNLFFLPPIGTLTIADPQNWAALFSFLATALIASRLSAKAKRRAMDAVERQNDLERLYTFSRAILLIDSGEPFAKQLARRIAEVFNTSAVVLYERRTGEAYRAGPSDFDGLEDQIREAAVSGSSYSDPGGHRVITAIRLGSEPIASLALQGARMADSVVQGIANLVAIGLERERAQDLAHQVEVARQSEQLRTTLIDAMAHEFKTPLTSIKAATTSLLASPGQPAESRAELVKIADEEADHLRELIDDAIEMAQLDIAQIELHPQIASLAELVREVADSMQIEIDGRPLEIMCDNLPAIAFDRRLLKLALRQLVDNSLKYSPSGTPIVFRLREADNSVVIEVTDHGKGIPPNEQNRVFDRFYRSPSVRDRIPGSGLGLSIAQSIIRAHHGDLAVTSRPGETTFRMRLPVSIQGEDFERRPHSGR
jgi:two-component system, OmpR family, sensor histidine kinase KdpD